MPSVGFDRPVVPALAWNIVFWLPTTRWYSMTSTRPKRCPDKAHRYAGRQMLRIRRTIHVALAATTFVATAPILASAAQPRTKSAAERCEWAAAHKAHLGAPLITDARGSYIAVLFVDHRDNYERFCLYGPHLGLGTSGQVISPGSVNPAPGPKGIQHNHGGGSCDPTTGRAVGEMFGRVGNDVTGATFRFSNGASVQATVKDGFYVAWWPWLKWPDLIIVKTKSGTARIQMHALQAHAC